MKGRPRKEHRHSRSVPELDRPPVDPGEGEGAPQDGDAPSIAELDWSPDTVRWWQDWCESPQTKYFAKSDWRRLLMVAPIVERYHAALRFKVPAGVAFLVAEDMRAKNSRLVTMLMTEIRMNESELGGTHVSRLRGRMKTSGGSEATASIRPATESEIASELANVPSLAKYRDRVARANG